MKSLVMIMAGCLMGGFAFADQDTSPQSFGAKFGTLGSGFEYTHKLSKQVNFRVGAYKLDAPVDIQHNGVEYEVDLGVNNVGAFVDYYPRQQHEFRISAGVLHMDNESDLSADSDNLVYQGRSYDAAVKGVAKQSGVTPYLGVGWDKKFLNKKGWIFSADAGLALDIESKIDMHVTRPPSDPAQWQQFALDVQTELHDIQNDAEDITMYPVISIGLSRHF